MKALLVEKRCYDVTIGEKQLGTFQVESEWNGLMKLIDNMGRVLIVRTPNPFESGDKYEVDSVMASPDLLL